MRKRDVEEEEEEDEERHTRRRLFQLRDDFLSKIRAHVGAHYFIAIVKYLTVEEAYQVSNLNVEIERYFHTYGVWQEYARDFLRRRGERLEEIVAQFRFPQEESPNYLWILVIWDLVTGNVGETYPTYVFQTQNAPRGPDRLYTLLVHVFGDDLEIVFNNIHNLNWRHHMRFQQSLAVQKIPYHVDYRIRKYAIPAGTDHLYAILYTLMRSGLFIEIPNHPRVSEFYIRGKLN